MRRAMWMLAVAVVSLRAETVDLKAHLEKTRGMFLASIAGLSEEQWTFKPAPERWSVAECAEHITASEDFGFGLISGKVMQGPAPAEKKFDDAQVVKMVTDRNFKAEAPPPLRPVGRWKTSKDVKRQFGDLRDRTAAFARDNADQLRSHGAEHPAFQQPVDAYQWLLFLSGHTERHTMQIQEVKAHANFPKH